MVGPSKILTVSYGTFSCTLEGFDDPFSTMRGIAEYFRDLAADDRYFGAEPPTPDAEMLHKIAEREVNRRVESQLKDDGIVLRQVEDQSSGAPAADDPAPEPAEQDDADGGNMFADIAAPSDDPTSLTAKLSRIRAVVGSGAAGAAATAAFDGSIDAAFADIETGDEAGTLGAVDLEFGGDDAPDTDIGHEDEAAEAVTETADVAPGEYDEAPEPEHAAPVAEPQADEPFAAVAPEPATGFVEATGYEAPAAYDDAAATAPYSVPEAEMEAATEAEDLGDLTALDGASPEHLLDTTEDASDEDLYLAGSDEAEIPVAEDEAHEEPAWDSLGEEFAAEETAMEATEAPDTAAEATELSDEAYEEFASDDGEAPVAETPPVDTEAAETPEATDTDTDTDTDTEAGDGADENQLGLAARIVKLKRAAMELSGRPQVEETPIPSVDMVSDTDLMADSDAADDDEDAGDGNLFDDVDDIGPEDAPAASEEALEDLSPVATEFDDAPESEEDTGDDEADAAEQSMLAAIAAATKDAEPVATAEEEPQEEPEAPSRPKSVAFTPEGTGEASEDSFDRILEQTNTRMDESEGNRRRSAIAHLKAAVAATKADRLLKRRGDDGEDADEQSRYRDDLAQVVRPQRPVTEPRPQTERPVEVQDSSPLVLVSELRVDEASGGDRASSILPRRIEREEGEMASSESDEQSFAEFAESMGATELPDLLEAAAAYSAFVEGRREFSRPQLMRRVANYEQDGYTREAGLRSFGQLLRQGKLQKLKRGQFTVTENTRFNPEARIAGE